MLEAFATNLFNSRILYFSQSSSFIERQDQWKIKREEFSYLILLKPVLFINYYITMLKKCLLIWANHMVLKAKHIIFFISFLPKYVLLRFKQILCFFTPRGRSTNSENLMSPRICTRHISYCLIYFSHIVLLICINLWVRQLRLKYMKKLCK